MVCQLFILVCNFTMETKMEGQFVIGSLFPLLLIPGVVHSQSDGDDDCWRYSAAFQPYWDRPTLLL